MQNMLRGLFALLFGSLVAGAGVGRAQGQPLDLAAGGPTWAVEVAAGSRCASFPGFVESIALHLPPERLAPPGAAVLGARVAVAGGGRARIEVVDQATRALVGERAVELPSGECDEIASAIGFILVVLVEAGDDFVEAAKAREAPTLELPPPEPDTEREVEDEYELERARRQAERKASSKRYAWLGPRAGHDVEASVGIGYGLLPFPSAGVSAEWRIRGNRTWPIGFQGTGWLPSETADGSGRFSAFYFGVLTCPLYFDGDRLQARACPGIAGGRVHAQGQGRVWNRSNASPLALAQLEAALNVRLSGPLSLALAARMNVPLFGLEFTFSSAAAPEKQRLYRVSPVTATGLLGLGLRFR